MKINTTQIFPEGFILRQDIDPVHLDIETEIIKFNGPLRVTAQVSKITNAITVELLLEGLMQITCARCLEDFNHNLEKRLTFVYEAKKNNPVIDLDPQIREEMIINYPLKPLCKDDCKGLCPKCGNNLNVEKCSCK